MKKWLHSKGFSLVELIVTILLMGIVAAVIFSRYISPSAFNASAARDAALTTARAAQQLSLGRDGVSFRVLPAGANWRFEAESNGTSLREITVPASGYTLTTGAVSSGATCNTLSEALDGFTVTYNSRGVLETFQNGGAPQSVDGSFNGVRLCINSDPALSLCISPGGFAHLGNCEP